MGAFGPPSASSRSSVSAPPSTAKKAGTPFTPSSSRGGPRTPPGVHANEAELFNAWLAERQGAEEAAVSTGAAGVS
eukprot:3583293-Prymnesium_polylepis.1